MKKILLLIAFIAVFAITGMAQTSDCPADKVCISRSAAEKAVETAKERDALKLKLEALQTAFDAQKALTQEVSTKLSYAEGRNSALEAQAVRDAAIIQAMIPMLRKKKIGLFNIF